MTCRDIDRVLMDIDRSVMAQLPAHAEQHLRSCKRCQDLVGLLDMTVAPDPPPAETLRRIEQKIAADLRPVHPLAPTHYFVAAFAGVFLLVVAIAVYRIGAFALDVMTPLQTGAILSGLAVAAGLLVYSLTHQMVPGGRHRIAPRRLPLLVVISLALLMAALFQFQDERNFWVHSWYCLRLGTAVGLVASLPFWLLLRRGAVLSPRVTGVAVGTLAGLAGTTALAIHCPNLHASHILVAHLGVAIFGAFAGLVVGSALEIFSRHSVNGGPV